VTQRSRNKAYVKGLPGAPELSEESRRLTGAFPDLHLRVWANIRGVNIHAYIDCSDGRGILRRTEVARALFQPSEVTEEKVVDWGRRALSHWLESRALAVEKDEVAAS
jgi:hypothetical protein